MRRKCNKHDSVFQEAYIEPCPPKEHATEDNNQSLEHWNLRACPRCHGDMFLESEIGDTFYHCLLCGYVGLTT
jgi:hypothetical protein